MNAGGAGEEPNIGRAAMWSVLGNGAGQALSLILFLIIARFVSPESFGIMAVSLAVMECVRRMAIDPIALALNARETVTDRDYDICFTLILTVSLGLGLILYFAAGLIAGLIGSPQIAETLQIVSIILATMGLTNTHGAWLGRHMQFRALAIRSVASVCCGGAVGVTMAVMGYDLWSLVGQQLTIAIVNILALWVATPWRPKIRFSRTEIVRNLRQSAQISFGSVWTSLANEMDIFIVSAYLGPAVTGIYNAAKRILLAANLMLVNAISSITLPAFARLGAGERQREAFLNGIALTSVLTAPAFAGLAAVGPDFIFVVLGPRWADAAPILMALAATGYILSLGQFATSVLFVAQRPYLDTLCAAIATTINAVCLLLAVEHGAIAVAVAASLSAFLILPLRMWLALRAIGLRWTVLAGRILPSIAAALIMASVLVLVQYGLGDRLPPIAILAVMVPIGMVVYFGALRLVSRSLFALAVAGAAQILGRRPERLADPAAAPDGTMPPGEALYLKQITPDSGSS